MKVCLSSDALPGEWLGVLLQAARRRALESLEITLGEGQHHGLDDLLSGPTLNGVYALDLDSPGILWLRVPPHISAEQVEALAGWANRLDAGLLVRRPVDVDGVRLALEHGSDPFEAQVAASWAREHGACTSWYVTLDSLTPDHVTRILEVTGSTLAHVRLPGSGAEGEMEDNAGVGGLLMELALRGYTGSVALIPSPDADLNLWREWLLEKKGWGCGSAARKKQIVTLEWNLETS